MGETFNLQEIWSSHQSRIVLGMLVIVFMAYSLFIAVSLKPGIIPDEPAHFVFSKHFSTTLGIPADTYETYSWGWYIEQNPFLYYWLSGRLVNLLTLFHPTATDWQILVFLRVFNSVFALGTVLFCFLLSKEVIDHRWWQLLPVFLLTNTLMFVFLAGGVNYDNLANLFSMAGLYFLVRVFKSKAFLINSFAWMASIALGTLVKYPILPLALVMGICWFVYILVHRKERISIRFASVKTILLAIFVTLLFIGNFAIYGVNLLRHQTLTPPCREILLESQCEISPYEVRSQAIALQPKLTVAESIELGHPSPMRYAGSMWVRIMLLRMYGVTGHRSYFPLHLINYFLILFYGVIGITILFWKRSSFSLYSLMGILVFYALVLLYQNYQSELVYGFQHIALQGRYIFPVIGAAYVIFTVIVKRLPNLYIKGACLAFTLVLFFIAGPLMILLGYDTIFSGWFY
jgi:hypothetical protein